MAKSLYEVKMDERKKSKPNLITDADYFLRDKEKEAELGYPNTIDITGLTTSSQEEANDIKVRDLQKQLADMSQLIDNLKEQAKTEVSKTEVSKTEVSNAEIAKTTAKTSGVKQDTKEVEGDK